jgi:hypothetical protein
LGKPKKKPRVAGQPSGTKRVAAATIEDEAGDGCLVWRMSLLDFDGHWGWRKVEAAKLFEIIEKMCGHEKSVATTTFSGGGNKQVPVERLASAAQARLRQLNLDDLDELWELRLTNKERVWGRRVRHLFYPIWWDPDHEVCPSPLKNT